jgi:hypothetical protein
MGGKKGGGKSVGGILGIGGSGRSEKSRSRSPSEVRIGERRGVKGRL